MKKYVHVCTTPALIDQFDVKGGNVVVIDVLRATTSICVAFGNGAKLVVPVAEVETCRTYRDKGFLIAGERNGEALEGFDLGNSPFEFMGPKIKGAKIAITTTNGTRAVHAARERQAGEILVGAFSNVNLLCDWLIERNENVCLLCSGWRDNFTLEDTVFAGAVAQRLRNHFLPYQDTNLMARTLYKNANSRKRYFFRNSSHFFRLVHLNLQKDVKYAMHRDTQKVLPLLVGDALYDFADVSGIAAKKKRIQNQQMVEQKSS